MSNPHTSEVPPDQPRANNPPDIQLGVSAPELKLWPFLDISSEIEGEEVTGTALIDYRFLDGPEYDIQKEAVRSTIHKNKKPPNCNFDTWEDYANVRFRERKSSIIQLLQRFVIRITFQPTTPLKPDGYECDSVVGTGVEFVPVDEPTMRLAGLPDRNPPEEKWRGLILHEFGHALGLRHEHQSPAAFDLDRKAVLDAYSGMEKWAEDDILRKFKDSMNYTKFDAKSIMVYRIYEYWEKRSWSHLRLKEIYTNYTLSELDKAFIQLMYPPDLRALGKEQRFREAMVTAGVPRKDASKMLSDFMQDDRSLSQRLTSIRDRFDRLKNNWWSLWNSKFNREIMRGINPASVNQYGVDGFTVSVAEDKLFQSIVKNIVYRTMEQRGVPMNVPLPGSTQHQVARLVGALAMHDGFGHCINQYVSQLSKQSNVQSESHDSTSTQEPS